MTVGRVLFGIVFGDIGLTMSILLCQNLSIQSYLLQALLGNAQMCLERGVEYGGEALPGTVCSGDEKSRYVKL